MPERARLGTSRLFIHVYLNQYKIASDKVHEPTRTYTVCRCACRFPHARDDCALLFVSPVRKKIRKRVLAFLIITSVPAFVTPFQRARNFRSRLFRTGGSLGPLILIASTARSTIENKWLTVVCIATRSLVVRYRSRANAHVSKLPDECIFRSQQLRGIKGRISMRSRLLQIIVSRCSRKRTLLSAPSRRVIAQIIPIYAVIARASHGTAELVSGKRDAARGSAER